MSSKWISAPWYSHLKYGHIIEHAIGDGPFANVQERMHIRRVHHIMQPLAQIACEEDIDIDQTDKRLFYSSLLRWGLESAILSGDEYWMIRQFLANFELA